MRKNKQIEMMTEISELEEEIAPKQARIKELRELLEPALTIDDPIVVNGRSFLVYLKTNRSVDESGLLEHLDETTRARVSSSYLDAKKLEAAIALGDISSEEMSQFVTETQKRVLTVRRSG